MTRVFALIAASLSGALLPSGAMAHAFMAGADGYTRFLEGNGVILKYPPALLPLMALGLLLGLWRADGMPKGWPYFFGGLVLGVGTAVISPPWVASSPLAIGIIVAVTAALAVKRVPLAAIAGLALAMGIVTTAAGLEGHGFLELSWLIHLGIFLAANLVVAVSAAAVRMSLDRFPQPWLEIGWRVAASWLAAIMLLYLAFSLRGYSV